MEDYQQFSLFFLIIIGFICFMIGFLSEKENIKNPLYITGGVFVFVGLGGIFVYPMFSNKKNEKRVHFDQEEIIIQNRNRRSLSSRRSSLPLQTKYDQKVDPSWPTQIKNFIKGVRQSDVNYYIREVKQDIPQMGWEKGKSGYFLDRQTLTMNNKKPDNQLLKRIYQKTKYKKL